jgi:hypothetical protein
VGHLGGGYLFEHGAAGLPFFLHSLPPSLAEGGSLPFILVGVLLLVSSVLIFTVSSLFASELQLGGLLDKAVEKAKASPPPTPDESVQPRSMGAEELSTELAELLPKIEESSVRSRAASGMTQ